MMTTLTAPRITARVDFDTQALLQQAAALSGITSINAFVLNAAIEKANAIIQADKTIQLNAQEAQALFDYLDNPPEPNEKLKGLVAKYRERK